MNDTFTENRNLQLVNHLVLDWRVMFKTLTTGYMFTCSEGVQGTSTSLQIDFYKHYIKLLCQCFNFFDAKEAPAVVETIDKYFTNFGTVDIFKVSV